VPRNLEFKAKVKELKSIERIFADHGAAFVDDLRQTDTYFCVPKGRLKIREIAGKKSEIIFYERDENSPAAMVSNYEVLPIIDSSLKNFLTDSLGMKVIVEKERRLLKMKNARIHLDNVKGLGEFLELEVVSEGDDAGDAELIDGLKRIVEPFVIEEISASYSDLVIRNLG